MAVLEGGAFESVIVQVLVVFEIKVVGLHCRDEIPTAAERLMFTLCDAPPYEAVSEPL
jgi:hypothetical protein